MYRKDILNYIAAHKIEFEKKFGVQKIGLFGSYARGRFTRGATLILWLNLKGLTSFV